MPTYWHRQGQVTKTIATKTQAARAMTARRLATGARVKAAAKAVAAARVRQTVPAVIEAEGAFIVRWESKLASAKVSKLKGSAYTYADE